MKVSRSTPVNSTRMSASLAGFWSPRAQEPGTPSFLTPKHARKSAACALKTPMTDGDGLMFLDRERQSTRLLDSAIAAA